MEIKHKCKECAEKSKKHVEHITLSKDDFNALMRLAKEGIKTIDVSYNAKCAYEILLKKLKGDEK